MLTLPTAGSPFDIASYWQLINARMISDAGFPLELFVALIEVSADLQQISDNSDFVKVSIVDGSKCEYIYCCHGIPHDDDSDGDDSDGDDPDDLHRH